MEKKVIWFGFNKNEDRYIHKCAQKIFYEFVVQEPFSTPKNYSKLYQIILNHMRND